MSAGFGSGSITPEDLIAYADGEADAQIVARIEADPALAAMAADYGQSQRRLQRRLHRIHCPSPQTLGEYDLGLLPPELRTQVAAHIADCPRCTADVRMLRAFLADEPSPAPNLAARARRLIATLLPPSRELAGAQLRGAVDEASRSYRADDVMITLTVDTPAHRGRSNLVGLIWRDDASADMSPAGSVTITGAGVTRAGTIDEFGNFAFDDMAPGTYQLEMALDDDRIAIEDFRIG